MPIVDVLLVHREAAQALDGVASAIADELGRALGEPPARVWVRLHPLPSGRYAENQASVGDDELPVFVTLLLARPPAARARPAHASAVCHAVARATGRAPERVHVEYAPPGAGRIAFGGQLVP
jgi:phenylpyruvate tautomerase PptA (4-oxalocrotonate tautomerase family)